MNIDEIKILIKINRTIKVIKNLNNKKDFISFKKNKDQIKIMMNLIEIIIDLILINFYSIIIFIKYENFINKNINIIYFNILIKSSYSITYSFIIPNT